jgi:hypothetical protein
VTATPPPAKSQPIPNVNNNKEGTADTVNESVPSDVIATVKALVDMGKKGENCVLKWLEVTEGHFVYVKCPHHTNKEPRRRF